MYAFMLDYWKIEKIFHNILVCLKSVFSFLKKEIIIKKNKKI